MGKPGGRWSDNSTYSQHARIDARRTPCSPCGRTTGGVPPGGTCKGGSHIDNSSSLISPVPGASWRDARATLVLRNNEVHVWRASLDVHGSILHSLFGTLSSDERVRAELFHSQRDRRHFIAGRGVLRAILALYLDKEPRAIRFCPGPNGKPGLVKTAGDDQYRFNVSHSDGLALYAVAGGREIGIDVERVQPQVIEGIADQFFSPRETADLQSLPPELQTEAFFACWTRKEAYIKARGEGLALRLHQFDVSLAPGEPAALLRTERDPHEAARWSLVAFTPAPGYVAALAAEGRDWHPVFWQWQAVAAGFG